MCNISLDKLKEKSPKGYFRQQVLTWTALLAKKYDLPNMQCNKEDTDDLWNRLMDVSGLECTCSSATYDEIMQCPRHGYFFKGSMQND